MSQRVSPEDADLLMSARSLQAATDSTNTAVALALNDEVLPLPGADTNNAEVRVVPMPSLDA